ncbi:hypothetical protein B0H16DRAFT_1585182 [Mycena metata]|uniref:Uncharacterized protein n=1 Tax=Mycena metata TaxID=1033252 RepID=A0AAD7MST3_9AGAR|nr:hypothetical protein B0H16DRAFT_1585182 [Mycena metata]
MPPRRIIPGEANAAVITFVSGPKYTPPSVMPHLYTALWEECASTTPVGAEARKALRAQHEISGKIAFEHGLVQISIKLGLLVGKTAGALTTLQRAVGSERVLEVIVSKINPKLIAQGAHVVSGFYEFVGIYFTQLDGDMRPLVAWLHPLFAPALRAAAATCPDTAITEQPQPESRKKIRIGGDHRFLLNAWGMQQVLDSEEEWVDAEMHGRLAFAPTPSPVRFDRPVTPPENDIMSTDIHRLCIFYVVTLHGFLPHRLQYNSPVVRQCPGEMNPGIWRINALASRHRIVSSMPFGQITPEELKFEQTEAPEKSPEPPRFVLDSVQEDPFSAIDPFEYSTSGFNGPLLLPAFTFIPKATSKTPQHKVEITALDTPLASQSDARSPLTHTNGRSPAQMKSSVLR